MMESAKHKWMSEELYKLATEAVEAIDSKKEIIECRAEELDWSVKWYKDVEEDTYVEFSKYSPAGEDFSFEVWYLHVSEIPEKVMEYYEEFDPEYHASLWADSAGRNGVPRLRELIEDADAIEEMIRELANALKEEN